MIPLSTPPSDLCDADLLAEYQASHAGAGDPREDALDAEIKRRSLNL